MLEQLRGQLAGFSYPDAAHRQHAAGLTQHCIEELTALGANGADVGSATTVSGAINAAIASVNGQSFPSNAAKQQALGRLSQLRDQLASIGVS